MPTTDAPASVYRTKEGTIRPLPALSPPVIPTGWSIARVPARLPVYNGKFLSRLATYYVLRYGNHVNPAIKNKSLRSFRVSKAFPIYKKLARIPFTLLAWENGLVEWQL
jgi:hypothetical protein